MTDPTDPPEDTNTEDKEQEYVVAFTGTATTYVEVTATNAEDAVTAAYDELSSSLCYQCAHPKGNGFRTTGPVQREWPEHMEVDEVTADGNLVAEDEYSWQKGNDEH